MVCLVLLLCYWSAVVGAECSYRGAVYEHTPVPWNFNVSPEKYIAGNLHIYGRAVRAAAKQGAQIIVFPEYGLTGFSTDREHFRKFLEQVPDPLSAKVLPCEDESFAGRQILRTVSCLARNHSMYVVVSLGEIADCTPGQACPPDGRLQLNTALAFQPDGRLALRQRKCHLYQERPSVDPAPHCDSGHVLVTPFARFGLAICFDLLFAAPTLHLVENVGVTDLLHPTAFPDFLPIFNSLMMFDGFSRGLSLNILASNRRLKLSAGEVDRGSGIFTPKGYLTYTYANQTEFGSGMLLVAQIPCNRQQVREHNTEPVTEHDSGHVTEQGTEKIIKKKALTKASDKNSSCSKLETLVGLLDGEIVSKCTTRHQILEHNIHQEAQTFEFLGSVYKYKNLLTRNCSFKSVQQVLLCNSLFCCSVKFSVHESSMDDHYVIAMSDGLQSPMSENAWYAQSCIVVACEVAATPSTSCIPSNSAHATTVFNHLTLAGNFTCRHVMPSLLLDGGHLTNKWTSGKKREGWTEMHFEGPLDRGLLLASLLSRCYERDVYSRR